MLKKDNKLEPSVLLIYTNPGDIPDLAIKKPIISFIGIFHLHFKYYPLSWFPFQKPTISSCF